MHTFLPVSFRKAFKLTCAILSLFTASAVFSNPATESREQNLIRRLRAEAAKLDSLDPVHQSIYRALLPWYETWGLRIKGAVDEYMVAPAVYAEELATTLEQGKNFVADNSGASFPMVFEKTLPDGRVLSANYYLNLPGSYSEPGRKFPLVIGLHGSGWLGHKISYVRSARKSGGPCFSVTPINEGGPWQIDFLNAFLDDLLARLPIDPDQVFLEGHSLGAMATWEWAMNNPERFAALSPRSGLGEPYRAQRLRNIPVWVIHGARDDVVSPLYADQMVSALEQCGARVRYSVLRDVEHNMPADLDYAGVTEWYLRQRRCHDPVPADPRDKLGLNQEGFSPWSRSTMAPGQYWTQEDSELRSGPPYDRSDLLPLVHRALSHNEQIDAPLLQNIDLRTRHSSHWLAVPKSLHTRAADLPDTQRLPERKVVRFVFKGTLDQALRHLEKITPEIQASGITLSSMLWVTPLSLWQSTPAHIAEYSVEIKPNE